MKLTEKQAFKVMDKIMDWSSPKNRDKEAEADFVMLGLMNLELEDERI